MNRLMLGNEAVARGAYEAGVTVATAYPGTPSTEITEYISRYDEIYSEWSPNEKVALEVAAGASIAGARAICSMKHVGLNVAADPLFTISYTGVNGGLVIMVADDPGMHSSQNEQDSRFYARASKVPMLEPSDSQECRDFVKLAFDLSEKYDCPVLVRLSTRIAHSRSIVETAGKFDYKLKDYVKNPAKYVMMPAMARKRHLVVEKRMNELKDYTDSSEINYIEWDNGGRVEIGVISSGIAWQYAKEAFGNVSYLKLGMVYPIPEKLIREFASKVKKLYVVEELEPFLENQIRKMGISVYGKDLLPVTGELSTSIIKDKMLNLGQRDGDGAGCGDKPGQSGPTGVNLTGAEGVIPTQSNGTCLSDIPQRPPVMCPGCPHRGVFHILKKLKLNVSGDIGCYTLGALPPSEAMDTCICMGASVSAVHGMEKARGRDFARNTVAVVGDSTFIHSGITGLIDIVYNKGNSTVIILDNSITGMTGHQHNPTTGYTIKNEPTARVDLVKLAEALGIERVRVEDPYRLKEFEKAVKEELQSDGPSVIIAKRPCALLKEVTYEGPLRINTGKCKKCKRCMLIGCPSIADKNGVMEINGAICVGCNLCAALCNFDAIEKAGDNNG